MLGAALIALSLLLPLAAVALIALAGALAAEQAHRVRRSAALFSPLTVAPTVVLTLAAPGAELSLDWLLFGTVLHMDAAARALVLIAALLYGAALMAVTWVKLRDAERGSGALSAFLMVCFAGNIGTYLAADAVTFYLAFAVMSFSAAGLVIHYRTASAHRATRIYLVMSVFSETAILAGLILTASAGGYLVADAPSAVAASEHTGLIVALLLIGFGVKAGTVPLHMWLPLAHPAAPPAASAVLSGAMVKAGLVGWLRFLPIGDDAAALATAGNTLLVLALLGAFAAVVVGVLQSDPKVVLAYSTISQMGFIACLVAVALLVPESAGAAMAAAVLYAVHHGLAKGALFLGVPVVKHYGRGGTGVLVLIGMAGAGLAVAGAPLTSGAYGKYVSKEAVEGFAVLGVGLDQLLPLVATGSTLLLIRFAFIVSHTEVRPRPGADGELASWLAVCAAGIAVPWLIGAAWLPDDPEFSWSAGALWDASWPILLALGLGAVVWLYVRNRGTGGQAQSEASELTLRGEGRSKAGESRARLARAGGMSILQPGDLIVAEESLAMRSWQHASPGLNAAHRAAGKVRNASARVAQNLAERTRRLTASAEGSLGSWEGSGLVILVLTTVAVLIIMWTGGVW
ncbi:complex I subunit 5 family protein [Nesterenkonia ebinurensis]|uniref:complex I subunit 5 family protein n=1 Tax=Nesterenkonia ebinurensis TaxID=2608252 RepID=UPI001CC37891|nr:complex I subunit 5 family protein [Nesterenkonia ebinurensis]